MKRMTMGESHKISKDKPRTHFRILSIYYPISVKVFIRYFFLKVQVPSRAIYRRFQQLIHIEQKGT